MKKELVSTDLLRNQNDLSNAIKGLKAFADDKFTYLEKISVSDLDGLIGLISCIEIASRQQTDNIIEFFE
ncbi:hypothetical protein DOK76_00695 [Vagococcus sp. DIV0080]|uniref:Uncharacterized protein n=1 Tax=Candidatus Vagococcus giribetii TaxID=2230876 RepID=A0ABS3HP95_9ENTE|nr:hypothetical protein [Vagococcus sp. DIV0080]MBO0475564.1 hypothetical protein [Vagococcus sp. DIV0080]